MNAPTVVTVEFVPWGRRTGELEGIQYAVVERDDADGQWIHLPGTDEECAMPLLDYGRKVAAEEGARWIEPPPWIPGVVDDFADVVDDGNGLVFNPLAEFHRHLKSRQAGAAA